MEIKLNGRMVHFPDYYGEDHSLRGALVDTLLGDGALELRSSLLSDDSETVEFSVEILESTYRAADRVMAKFDLVRRTDA